MLSKMGMRGRPGDGSNAMVPETNGLALAKDAAASLGAQSQPLLGADRGAEAGGGSDGEDVDGGRRDGVDVESSGLSSAVPKDPLHTRQSSAAVVSSPNATNSTAIRRSREAAAVAASASDRLVTWSFMQRLDANVLSPLFGGPTNKMHDISQFSSQEGGAPIEVTRRHSSATDDSDDL